MQCVEVYFIFYTAEVSFFLTTGLFKSEIKFELLLIDRKKKKFSFIFRLKRKQGLLKYVVIELKINFH